MRSLPLRTLPLLTALAGLGCQEPFGTDRHDLVGLRVAGIRASAIDDDTVQLSISAVVDGRPYSDEALDLHWFEAGGLSAEEIAELSLEGSLATGPRPEIDRSGPSVLALLASDGTSTWRGTVSLPEPSDLAAPPGLGALVASRVDRPIETLTGEDLDLEVRREWETTDPVDSAAVGDFVRFSAEVDAGVRVRWMSTAPSGTFLGVDDGRTDWVSATYVRDDEDLEDLQLEDTGARTLVALAMDPAASGANAWAAREFFVGEVPTGVFTASGRFLPTDAAVEGSHVRGSLVADDTAPAGIRLESAQAATADEDPGTSSLPCAVPVDGPFDPDWLLQQWCSRTAVIGASVVVEVRP